MKLHYVQPIDQHGNKVFKCRRVTLDKPLTFTADKNMPLTTIVGFLLNDQAHL
jgi:hypothetical protein